MKTYNAAEVSRFPWSQDVLRMMMMMYRYRRMGLTHWNSCCLASANLGEVVEDIFFLYEKFNVFAYIWVANSQLVR